MNTIEADRVSRTSMNAADNPWKNFPKVDRRRQLPRKILRIFE